METIPKDEVCRMICKYCIKVNKFCQHRWDCPLLTEIAKYKDEPQTEDIPIEYFESGGI